MCASAASTVPTIAVSPHAGAQKAGYALPVVSSSRERTHPSKGELGERSHDTLVLTIDELHASAAGPLAQDSERHFLLPGAPAAKAQS